MCVRTYLMICWVLISFSWELKLGTVFVAGIDSEVRRMASPWIDDEAWILIVQVRHIELLILILSLKPLFSMTKYLSWHSSAWKGLSYGGSRGKRTLSTLIKTEGQFSRLGDMMGLVDSSRRGCTFSVVFIVIVGRLVDWRWKLTSKRTSLLHRTRDRWYYWYNVR